jgi:hypothetical protein
MKIIKLSLNREISSHLAFLIMIILSSLLSWYTIAEGKKITENAKKSQTFNFSERIEK